MQRPARIEGGSGAVAAPLATLGRSRLPRAAVRNRLALGCNTVITGGKLPLRALVALQGRLEGTQGRCAPGAIEGRSDGGRVLRAPRIPSRRPRLGGAFAREDRLDERQASHACPVTDHVVQLAMHRREGLLPVLDVTGGIGQQGSPLASRAPQHDDLLLRADTGGQHAGGVETLEPLAIMHVTRGPPVAGHLAGIDAPHLEAAGFAHLEPGAPVDAGRCQGDCGDTTVPAPVRPRVEGGRVGAEAADGLGGIAGRDSRPVLFGPHLDASGVEVHGVELGRQGVSRSGVFTRAGSHGTRPKSAGQQRQRAGERQGCSTLLNGIRTPPVTNAVAAGLPGPHFQQRARSTNARTVSDAPLRGESIRQTHPQCLPLVQPQSGIHNFPGTTPSGEG